MKSELTNFPFKILNIITAGQEPLVEAALNHISNNLKSMDKMQLMDMEFGRETVVNLDFDEIEVASLIIMTRNVLDIKLTLILKDDQGQTIS